MSSPAGRASTEAVVAAAVLLLGVIGVGRLRGPLAESAHDVKQEDVYVLPPPSELRAMTLGYHAAAVDLLWAKLLVDYGIHWHEKRELVDVPKYLDAIVALEPDYPPLYRYCDTLLVYRPLHGTIDDARRARAYLQAGAEKYRPNDWHVWLAYGQFTAFLGPSFLTDEKEKEAWKKEGAEAIVRAVDLGADPDRSMAAASIFNRYGDAAASRKALERAYDAAQDDETREEIVARLRALEDQENVERLRRDREYVERTLWPFRFLSRAEAAMLLPDVDPARCAGPDSVDDRRCAREWSARLPSTVAAQGEAP